MKAGQTNLEVGTKVQLQNIGGEFKDLNGLNGEVTHPFAFGCTDKGWVGIYLEGETNYTDNKVNVKVAECKIL
jgi:hypothetical protein